METSPLTEQATAQATMSPRQMTIERTGDVSAPMSRRFPIIRGGVCDHCGIIDRNYPAEMQYKLCPHYRGMQMRCSYCDASKNPDDVIYHTVMNVAEHPEKPGVMIAWCNATECSKKHAQRFVRNF